MRPARHLNIEYVSEQTDIQRDRFPSCRFAAVIMTAAALAFPSQAGVASNEVTAYAATPQPTPDYIQPVYETPVPESTPAAAIASVAQVAPTPEATPAPPAVAPSPEPTPTQPPSVTDSSPQPVETGQCTTARTGPNKLVIAKVCENNAVAESIGSLESNGQAYSALRVSSTFSDGSVQTIYKCGYIRTNVLPSFEAPADVVDACLDFHEPLTEERLYAYRKINCVEILGKEACRDGAPGKKLVKKRVKDTTLYANYATDDPSVFNVLGTGEGGFSDPIAEQGEKKVRWRATARLGSADGDAALVRGVGTDWGFVLQKGISKATKTNLGTPAEFSPDQIKQIKAHPSSWHKYKKFQRAHARYMANS